MFRGILYMDVIADGLRANDTTLSRHASHQGLVGLLRDHSYLTSVVVLLLTLYIVLSCLSPTTSPEEPVLISHPVPFVGHLLGILKDGVKYFDQIGYREKVPIFTVPVLNGKTYVITSPDLVVAAMRESRSLSFNPFIVEVFRRMAHFSNSDVEATKLNMDDRSQPSYMTDMHRVEYAALAPGPAVDQMNSDVLANLSAFIQDILPSTDTSSAAEINLYATLLRIAGFSTLRATFGPLNPFDKDPGLLDDLWLFESNLKYLLIDVLPAFTVRKPHQARARLIKAFMNYFRDGAHMQASRVVQDRYTVAVKWGLKLEVIAALELGFAFGTLANALPTLFWLLVYVHSDPALLQEIRDETAHLLEIHRGTTVPGQSCQGSAVVNLQSDKHVRATCPILTSTFHETLRIVSSTLGTGRYVLQDTVLTASSSSSPSLPSAPPKSYLLKAGSIVQIPSQSLHHPAPLFSSSTSTRSISSTPSLSPFSTGLPSHTFDPYRFTTLGPKSTSASEPERTLNGSFRSFGGGATLCPGRKFAFVEITAVLVLFVQLFDVEGAGDVDSGGASGDSRSFSPSSVGTAQVHVPVPVCVPEREESRLAVSVAKPKKDVRLRVKRRKGFEGLVISAWVGERVTAT